MKKETMQAVTYHCDVCGVKLPVTPQETSEKVDDQLELSHFVMVINSATVRETFIKLGDGPSHGRARIEEVKQIDVCQGCSKFPLSFILQKAAERAEKRRP